MTEAQLAADRSLRLAKLWVEEHGAPLPLDLVSDLLAAGYDASTIETQLLENC